MKNSYTVEQGGERYTFCFDIRGLRAFEQELGHSLQSMYASGPAGIIRLADIGFTTAGIRHGLQNRAGVDPYDIIDEFCQERGGLLDTLNGAIFQAINCSGFFVKPPVEKNEPAQVAPEK